MGAHDYQYVVPLRKDVQAALDDLRRQVFESGDFHGEDEGAESPEEALEMSGASGTRSILDITRVADAPQSGCTAPLTSQELLEYFGTEQPTQEMVESCEPLWDGLDRGAARHVVVYEAGAPAALMFIGYSYD